MRYSLLLVLLGAILLGFGLLEGGWLLLASWLGCNFLIVGIAHAKGWHRIFGKQSNGTLPPWSWLLFLPLHLYTLIVWHGIRFLSREPAYNVVTDHLTVGRRLLPSELDQPFDNYVDLTAEFFEPVAIRRATSYRSFPVLDAAAPTTQDLRAFLSTLRPGRTFVHCAQGHGRTGLVAAAVLLYTKEVLTAEEALRILKRVRPGIALNNAQNICLQIFENGSPLKGVSL